MVAIMSLLILGKYFSKVEVVQNAQYNKCNTVVTGECSSSNVIETNAFKKIDEKPNFEIGSVEKLVIVCSVIAFLFIVSVVYEITA